MAIDADASKANINTAQFFNQLRNIFYIFRIWKYSLFFRHNQFRINLTIYGSVHKSTETQRMCFRNPFLIIIQILIHIDKPYIFQTDFFLIYHFYKIRILSYRTYRTNKYSFLSFCIIFLNFLCHFLCHRLKYRCIIFHYDHWQFRSFV